MARAAVQYYRSGPDWVPVGVWYGTPGMLASRFLPSSGMDDFVRHVHQTAVITPKDDGSTATWEDFIDFSLDAFSNGYTMSVVEVQPEATVDRTYAKYVLGLKGKALDAYRVPGVASMSTVHVVEEVTGPGVRA